VTWEDTVKAYQEEILKLQLEEAKYRRSRAMFEAAAAAETLERAKTANRPAVLFGAVLSGKYDKWIASAQGIYAYGETPEEAYAAFDKAWTTKIKNEASLN
jgi:hypothetical protein